MIWNRKDNAALPLLLSLNLQAGSAVVVTYPGKMRQPQRDAFAETLAKQLPAGVVVIVLDNGFRTGDLENELLPAIAAGSSRAG